MEILEKVRNIIKNKFNSEAKYSEKYLKSKEKTTKKQKAFNVCMHQQYWLIQFIEKNGNCYPKVFLEKKLLKK